jgi:hypothetical protein
LLAVLCLSAAACGSVANKAGTGGTSGSDAGTAGSSAGGDNGGGGSTGAGGSAAGGMTGSTDAGTSDGPKLVARGAIIPFGILAPASGATVHVTQQRFGPTFACNGNVCFSGGLLLP